MIRPGREESVEARPRHVKAEAWPPHSIGFTSAGGCRRNFLRRVGALVLQSLRGSASGPTRNAQRAVKRAFRHIQSSVRVIAFFHPV
jgi:hypothetical protein